MVARAAATRGLTLVELMISMLLGVLLSGAVVGAYVEGKRSYFRAQQVARMQENGRYAMRLLSRELAMAGFFGGVLTMENVAPGIVGTDCSSENWALDGGNSVDVVNDYAGEPDPVSASDIAFTCLDGAVIRLATDILALKRTAAAESVLRGVAAPLTPSTVQKWYLRILPVQQPEWQQQRPVDLLDASLAESELTYWQAVAKIFFIRNYSDTPGDGVPALCMETLAGNAMTSRCLVEGVEDMQLEFGIDTDGDSVANRYTEAPGAGELRGAVAVRVHLLIRSIDQIGGHTDRKTYALGRKAMPARGDAYLRRVFTTTIRLRSRIRPIG